MLPGLPSLNLADHAARLRPSDVMEAKPPGRLLEEQRFVPLRPTPPLAQLLQTQLSCIQRPAPYLTTTVGIWRVPGIPPRWFPRQGSTNGRPHPICSARRVEGARRMHRHTNELVT